MSEKGLQYRTLNPLRSAISAYHVHIDGKSVGKHPKVGGLLAGILPLFTNIRTHLCDNLSLTDADLTCTSQKLKFPIKDFFSKCEQIRIIENFIFCPVL